MTETSKVGRGSVLALAFLILVWVLIVVGMMHAIDRKERAAEDRNCEDRGEWTTGR